MEPHVQLVQLDLQDQIAELAQLDIMVMEQLAQHVLLSIHTALHVAIA
jgi:hypothetical protein